LLRGIFIIIIVVLFVYLFLNINIVEFSHILESADVFYLFLIGISDFVAIIMFIIAWHVVIRIITGINFKHNFIATLLQIFGNIMIPSASLGGEYLRISYLKSKTNVDVDKLLASIAINRFQYGITMIAFILLGIFFLTINGLFSTYIFLALFLIFLFTFFLYFLTFKSKYIKNLTNRIIAYTYRKFNRPRNHIEALNKINDFIDKFDYWIKRITKTKLWIIGILFMVLQWIFNSFTIYLAFLAVHASVNFSIIAFTYPIFVLLTVTPLGIPGNLGFLDLIMIAVYTKLGIDLAYATAATLIARTFMLLEDLFISLPFAIKHRKHYLHY